MNRYILLLIPLLIALLMGCRSTVTAETPPTIVYGEDVCDLCGMIITDERFAAGLVVQTAPGRFEHRIFDDIGDMFVYAQQVDDPVESYFVHDYHSLGWIAGETAFFVRSAGLNTPMGFGLAAFEDEADAQALAAEMGGDVLIFGDLVGQLSMPGNHGHMQHRH